MCQRIREELRCLYFPELTRRVEDKNRGRIRKFKLFPIGSLVRFLFRLFAFDDFLAEGAGMFAVKSLHQGFRDRRLLGVTDQHSHPGERLKKRPVQPD